MCYHDNNIVQSHPTVVVIFYSILYFFDYLGFQWLLQEISQNYPTLSQRVERDYTEQVCPSFIHLIHYSLYVCLASCSFQRTGSPNMDRDFQTTTVTYVFFFNLKKRIASEERKKKLERIRREREARYS